MKQYIVDALTDKLFCGNQAAVCVVDEFPSDGLMLNIARENNFSETAFTKRNPDGTYDLRWFTPAAEIDFCGHATMGTAFVLFNYIETETDEITFHTLYKGDFFISRNEKGITMDFPAFSLNSVPVTDDMETAFGVRPVEAYFDRDLLCVFEDDEIVKGMHPALSDLRKLNGLCVAVTAKSSASEYDCVSRVFAPDLDIYEDSVTGSTHCMIAPYWAQKLGKSEIKAFQASARTGRMLCRPEGNRVKITSNAVLYSISELKCL